MGWWGNYIGYDLGLSDIKAELLKNYSDVVCSTFKFGEFYASVRYKDEVVAMVVLWRYNKNNGELHTKTMDESMIPCYYKPTAKLLKSLTTTTDINSLKWRKICWDNFKNVPKSIQVEFDKYNIT